MHHALVMGLFVCALSACGDDTSTADTDDTSTPDAAADSSPADSSTADLADVDPEVAAGRALLDEAEALMWRALGGEVALRADALATFEAGLAALPDDPRGSLLYGMTLLSAIAEDNDIASALKAGPALEHAIAVNPDDRRIPGWLGTIKVGLARFTGDEQTLAEAIDFMLEAADLYPEFNNVSLAIAFAKLPLDTGYPTMAKERLLAIVDCVETLDVCQNNARAPHNNEGSLMLFGDVHARLGETDAARAYYDAALASPDAATWDYADEARAVRDALDARVALYLDADPANDPLFFAEGRTSCVGCHAP
ncbi:MAG: hypothetical protein IT385_23330 [Deltaproteobacteria bacterium]|nr:hypothetical protein [Deltaproteobacteria bacterium]